MNKPVGIVEPIGGHGGMDYYDYGLSMGLGNAGQPVFFYTCDQTRIREFKNVTTIIAFNNLWKASFLKKILRYISGHYKAFSHLKKNGGVIAHLHFFTFRAIDLIIILLGKIRGLKVVVTVHDVNAFDQSGSGFIEKICYKLLDGVVVHNQSSYLALQSKKVAAGPVDIIPHGNYLPFINAQQPAARAVNKPFTILFFGQIKKVKGLDVLIEAAGLLLKERDDFKINVAGKSWKSDLDDYTSMISGLGLEKVISTRFEYIPDNEVADLYAEADLIILPYKEIYQSGVLLLSMSYGKVILCSDLSAFTEIITDSKNGFIFKSEDPASLKSKLSQIIDTDEVVLDQVRKNALLHIQDVYDWNKIGLKTAKFYQSLVQ